MDKHIITYECKIKSSFSQKMDEARIHGQPDHYWGNAYYAALIVDTINQIHLL